MHDPKFSLTIGPAKLAAPPGHAVRVVVFNTGRMPLAVRMKMGVITRVNGKCEITGPAKWAHSVPRTFALQPHRSRVVRVSVNRHDGKPGTHDLAVTAQTVLGHRGNVHLNGAVAAQGLVRFPGHVAANAPRACVSLPAHATATPAWPGLIVLAVLVLVLALIVRKIVRRHRRRSA